jgi:cytidylate kinase
VSKQNVVAVDGPAGSGKSTVAKLLAEQLGLLYIDTGSMFRAIGYYLNQNGIDVTKENLDESDSAKLLLDKMNFSYRPKQDVLIEINGEDLTDKIRHHSVSSLASFVSQYSIVRDYLAKVQRTIALTRESILEGRDIGTIIFPQAKLKIYLTASAEDRANRRIKDLQERGQTGLSKEEILKDIIDRDYRDMSRKIAPLKKADDAKEIDTTGMTIEQVVDKIKQIYQQL